MTSQNVIPASVQLLFLKELWLIKIFYFCSQKIPLSTFSKTRGAEQFKSGTNKVEEIKVASKSHPKIVCRVRQPLFDPVRKGSRHPGEVSGGCLHLVQTEQHRALHTFSGMHPSASQVQNRFPQSEAINQSLKAVLAQTFVQQCDSSTRQHRPQLWGKEFGGGAARPLSPKSADAVIAFVAVSLTTF